MYLKRLEMHGFKSFADKTTFDLTPGVTVIVGPNGCGKSNITDAIRWVLGEQSARHLRGLRMEDIIFNGSANRKRLSFAEVSLTFDHSDGVLGVDYREITITRRLYRNGESEYLLNKQPCRLRDILELFMDSGVGKEAYSFIGQGRVEEIIQSRPEERRHFFEEAAGILKYKNRKRETERRLAETAENLIRVGDIIHELSAQLEPLAVQAEQANKYLSLRDNLKKHEVDLLVSDALGLRQRWYEVDDKLKTVADELLKQKAAVSRQEAQLTTNQFTYDEEQAAVTALQQEVNSLNSELEKTQTQIAVLEEKIHGVERQLAESNNFLADLQQEDKALCEEIKAKTDELERLSSSTKQAETELAQAQERLETLDNSAEVKRPQAIQAQLEQIMAQIQQLKLQSERLAMEKRQLEEKLTELKAEQETKIVKTEALKEQYEELLARKKKIIQQKELKNQELAALNQEQQNIIQQQERLTQKYQTEEKLLAAANNKLAVLQELEENMAGYYRGVKTILTARNQNQQFKGIFGTVADLLEVPPRYVAAVEAALGSAQQNLVADSDKVVREAIAYLKRCRGGRATFLPLNILKTPKRHQQADKLKNLPGYIGIAADLVKSKDLFAAVKESLLGRIHFVTDLEAALPVAEALNYSERVVTLDGDMIAPGGVMSGGFEKKQGGVLSRRKELAALKKTLQQHEEQLISFQAEARTLQEYNADLNQRIVNVNEQCQHIELQLGLNENEISFLQKQLSELTSDKEKLLLAEEKTCEQLKICQANIGQAAAKLASVQAEENKLRSELLDLADLLAEHAKEKQRLQEYYTNCRVNLVSLQRQQERGLEEKERCQGLQDQLQKKYQDKMSEIQLLQEKRNQLDATLQTVQAAAMSLQEKRSLLISKLAERETALKTMSTQYRETTEFLRQQEKNLAGLERKQARLDMERERIETELQHILTRLHDSWELEFEAAQKLANPIQNREIVQKSIKNIKEEMSSLGNVNLGAIEEYQRVKERVDFLKKQRADLQEGEKDLLRIIREIDSRMGEKFLTTFTTMQQNFAEVFKDLFGGGRAQLRLTDSENPLEAGIEIVAQPPGKKLQHLSLLSGGEKALTAISLLFAFLKLRPAPFCVLDEIESALDEANLVRFNNFLRIFSKQTQFFLISHRKRTMEQADILYGVTMEESGVSKIISVRLRDNNDIPGESA
ncbi:MAG: chromosome segregation protein SMC [Firmicutes bacterium]|nr:chromosome segregation protein SMC [Bacillota bacterium]